MLDAKNTLRSILKIGESKGKDRTLLIEEIITVMIEPKRYKKNDEGKERLGTFIGASKVPITDNNLINEIHSKCPMNSIVQPKIGVYYTIEAAIWLIHQLGYVNVTLITDDNDQWIKDNADFFGYQYLTSNELKEQNLKFDLEILNPPFQGVDSQTGCLWANIVATAYDHLEANGILCPIIPDSWMGGTLTKSSDKKTTKGSLRHKVIDNLNITHISTGDRINAFFPGIANNFSYFIGIKQEIRNETILETNLGIDKLSLSDCKFIPSYFNLTIKSLLDDTLFCNDYLKIYNGKAKCRIVKDLKKGTSDVQDKEHPYPFVTTSANYSKGIFGYSKIPALLFKEPKVIWSNSGHNVPFYDQHGQYGLGDHAEAVLVNSDYEGEMLTWFLSESKLIKALSKLKASSGKESGFTAIGHFIPNKIRHLLEPSDDSINNLFGFSNEVISLIDLLSV